ncbi:MAG: histidinol-phosphatase HisJ family protein [Peptococcaceae bacterium]|jgi:histidinol-phosphatase (PHP family)|nr:histidinol-phosphatase HisJ family protein [Peptococcaceae bacterium]
MGQKYYDYHMHSLVSMDSSMDMGEACMQAISMGMAGICFTEHQDFFSDHAAKNSAGHVEIDMALYQEQINRVRVQYGDRLAICQGVELGLQACNVKEVKAFLADRRFDFIIGSIHTIDRREISTGAFYAGKEKEAAYMAYFQAVYDMVQTLPVFHCLGHLDLVRRYQGYTDNAIDYEKFGDIIDAILQALITQGLGIEVNTAGLRYGVGSMHPDMPILKRYRELGGDIITCGSDAHRANHVAMDIKEAYALLKACGFSYVSRFIGGKEEKIPLL